MKTKLYLLLLTLSLSGFCYGQNNIFRSYIIAIKDTFQIQLNDCFTCGYTWQWINKTQVTSVDSIKSTIIGTSHKHGIVGGWGIYCLTFKGLRAGIDTIKLVYGQAWDKSTQKDTAFVFVKVIKAKKLCVIKHIKRQKR